MKTFARESCKTEIVRRLRTVRHDSRPVWGRMSAHQMVCHLADAFRMAVGERPVRRVDGPLPAMVLKWFALYLPLPWPSGVPTCPELDQQTGGTPPVEFARDVADVEALMNVLATQGKGDECPQHPLFGRMSRPDWLRWAYLHTAHHLRQFGA